MTPSHGYEYLLIGQRFETFAAIAVTYHHYIRRRHQYRNRIVATTQDSSICYDDRTSQKVNEYSVFGPSARFDSTRQLCKLCYSTYSILVIGSHSGHIVAFQHPLQTNHPKIGAFFAIACVSFAVSTELVSADESSPLVRCRADATRTKRTLVSPRLCYAVAVDSNHAMRVAVR